jgi:hypothetical protein
MIDNQSTRKVMTVTIDSIPNFAALSVDQAEEVLYTNVIPACEKEGVYFWEGNICTHLSMEQCKQYLKARPAHKLFDINLLKKVFECIPNFVKKDPSHGLRSFDLIREINQSEAYKPGDIITAMLLHGFSVTFKKGNLLPEINCLVRARFLSMAF